MSISIAARDTAGHQVVAVTGEIDVSNASELREALTRALDSGCSRLEVDLAEAPYIDSSGIGVLVGAAHRASDSGCAFAVVHPQPGVLRVLTLLGMDGELGLRK